MIVRVSSVLLDGLLTRAASQTTEICGLLLGRAGEIIETRPAENVAADPARHFEIDPAVLIAAHRAARGGGLAVMGHYHSHPSGTTEPSRADAAAAIPDDALWLILAQGQARLWRAGHEGLHGRFAACLLEARRGPESANRVASLAYPGNRRDLRPILGQRGGGSGRHDRS